MTDLARGPDAIWTGTKAEAEEAAAERRRVHGAKFRYDVFPTRPPEIFVSGFNGGRNGGGSHDLQTAWETFLRYGGRP